MLGILCLGLLLALPLSRQPVRLAPAFALGIAKPAQA